MSGRASFPKRHFSFLCWMGAWICIAGPDAHAAPKYGYGITPAPSGAPSQVIDSPSPVSASSNYSAAVSGGTITTSASVAASSGQVGGGSHATLNLPEYSFGASGHGQTQSYFSMDNIVISGPPGETVTYSVNTSISGGIGAAASGSGAMYAAASVTVKYSTGSSLGGIGNADGGSMSVDHAGGVTRTGAFAGFPVNSDGNSPWTTPTWQARAGDTISVGIILETSAVVDHRFGGSGFMDAFSDFSNTVMFSTTGPVFNLPLGWTVNSTDGTIVNNTFVPEPSALTMTLAAAGAWLLHRRRHDRRIILQSPAHPSAR